MCQLTLLYPGKKLNKGEHAVGRLLFTNLLFYNAKCGNTDGVGMVSGDGKVAKWEDSAINVIPTEEWAEKLLWSWENPTLPIIGHVRAVSTGLTAVEGAHPFHWRNVVGVHNGTFSNYKHLMKDVKSITDPSPVDSQVIVHMLGEEVGSNPITAPAIKTVMDKTTGSYAMMLLSLPNNTIWVVRGSCQLHYVKYGPFHVVNTMETSLNSALAHTTVSCRVGNLPVFLPEEKAAPLETFTMYTAGVGGLVQQGTLTPAPVSKGVTIYQGGKTYHRSGVVQGSPAKTINKDEDALERARIMRDIMLLPGIFETDVDLITQLMFDSYWYDMPVVIFEALKEGMKSAETFNSQKKNALWWKIQALAQFGGHEAVATLFDDFEIPYYLNTEETLKTVLTTMEELNAEPIVC